MLKKILWMATMVVLLAASVTGAGCSSRSPLADMVAKAPGSTMSFKYVDAAALRADDDLSELYGAWKATVDGRLESHGIASGDVGTFAFGTATGMRYTLLKGRFDLEQVRDRLKQRGFNDGEYKGVEIWEAKESWYDSDPRVALMDGLVILGDKSGVEGCIKVVKGIDPSFLKKAHIREVVDRTPAGLYVDLEKSVLASLIVRGLQAYTLSALKEDRDTLGIAGVARFEDAEDADDGEAAVETMMRALFQDVDVIQKGDYITVTAELDIDRSGFLFNGL